MVERRFEPGSLLVLVGLPTSRCGTRLCGRGWWVRGWLKSVATHLYCSALRFLRISIPQRPVPSIITDPASGTGETCVVKAKSQILPDTPVPAFVGIRESRFGNRFAESKMIEGLGPGIEAGSDVAQSVPGSDLCENHTREPLPESKMADREFGLVTLYYAVEGLAMDQVENLGKNKAAGVHGREFWNIPPRSSNPSHPFLSLIDSFEMPSRNLNSI